jgi:Predicted unsaturated glucuronyl hydrolase involved in regulation of bacterial surface properties, and related proteins
MDLEYEKGNSKINSLAVQGNIQRKGIGTRSGNKTTNADDQNSMQTYIDLYAVERDESRIANTVTCMDNMVNQPKVDYWTWVGAIFMSMPVLTKLSVVKGNTSYSEEAYKLFSYTKNTLGLYNPSNSF